MALKKRHETILNALRQSNGTATVRQIAEFTGFSVNGISQSLGCEALRNHVEYLDGDRGDARWSLITPQPTSSSERK